MPSKFVNSKNKLLDDVYIGAEDSGSDGGAFRDTSLFKAIKNDRSWHTTWRDTAYTLLFRHRRWYCNKEIAAKHDKTISTQEYDSQRDLDLAEWEE